MKHNDDEVKQEEPISYEEMDSPLKPIEQKMKSEGKIVLGFGVTQVTTTDTEKKKKKAVVEVK